MNSLLLSAISLLTGLFALWLRCAKGFDAREAITHLVGYEVRASIEHFLGAISAALMPMAYLVLTWFLDSLLESCGIRLVWPFGKKRLVYEPVKPLDQYFGPSTSVAVNAIWGMAYFFGTFAYEVGQAYSSALSATPRGYIQWEQVAADASGVSVGLLVGYWLLWRKDSMPALAS